MAEQHYDPSLEFSGFEASEDVEETLQIARRPLSLVLLKSPVLSMKRRVVNLTQHPEVTIGRDRPTGSSSPRLRLKEMPVSKYHAILYWDVQREVWGLIDVGSVHGTFVQAEGGESKRLSPSKVASHPHILRHLDVITVGGTQFQCHMHPNDTEGVCSQCESNAGNLLPLTYPHAIAQKTSAPEGHAPPSNDPKTSMASLKRHLLARHEHKPRGSPGPSTYVDRAALRREQLGSSQPPLLPTPVTIPQRTTSRHIDPYARLSNAPTPEQTPPPAAISESNIGHRLLAKQGWQPGTGLGLDQAGRAEPIILKPSERRAGLGMSSSEV